MAERPIRHRYPIWLSWPLELVALLIVVLTVWHYLHVSLQILLQQYPFLLDANRLGLVSQVRQVVLVIANPLPAGGPANWSTYYETIVSLNVQAILLFLLAALVRNFLPRVDVREQGLRVRRGLGWTTLPWNRITQVQSMTLPGDRLVLLIQGRRLKIGPWFRFYSLLWGAGLKKGVVVTWHISDFDTLAQGLVGQIQEVYGEDQVPLIVDDSAYSFVYALLFLPRVTWGTLFAKEQVTRDAYSHSRWLRVGMRVLAGILLVLAAWRYLGVWWRFAAGRFPVLANATRWPLIGLFLRTFGQPGKLAPSDTAAMGSAALALVLAQVSMILVLVAVVLLLNLFPDWLLGAEGMAVYCRKRWMQIPWEAIVLIRETMFGNNRGVILVQVKRSFLTFWHSLNSLLYGAGLRRGVLFTSLLPGFVDLRQRMHLGIVAAHERDTEPPAKPILIEDGEAEVFQMVAEPKARLVNWVEQAAPEDEAGAGLFRAGGFRPTAAGDLPWEKSSQPEEKETLPEDVEARVNRRKALGAGLAMIGLVAVLVLLEELLFPALSRPLAIWSLPPVDLARGPLGAVLVAVFMALLVGGEWFFVSFLLGMVADMYELPGEFKRMIALYPRIQSPRLLVALGILALGFTGIVQPLFLLWWIVGLIWGAVLVWLVGEELYGWGLVGHLVAVGGFVLYQILMIVVYFLLR